MTNARSGTDTSHATTLQASVAVLDHARKVADDSVARLVDQLGATALSGEEQVAIVLAMRSVINDIEVQSLQSIIDATSLRRPGRSTRADLERKAIEAVLSGTEWFTGDEVGQRHNAKAKNKHAAVSRWQGEGKVFAIERTGQRLYAAYLFDEFWNPRPEIAQILKIFNGYTPFRIASWFESINPALGGKRPREVIRSNPDAVVGAARDHVIGPVHG